MRLVAVAAVDPAVCRPTPAQRADPDDSLIGRRLLESGPTVGPVPSELRRARLAVSVVFAVCGAGFATWAARIPAAQQRLGLDAGGLAVALFGSAAGSVAALVVAASVITRFGSRRTAVVGAVLLCAGLPAAALAPDPLAFTGGLLVLGAGNGLLDVAMNAHAARVEHAYGRPIFAGFHAWWSVGGLVGAGTGAALADVPIGVHFPLAATALLVVALGAAAAFLGGPDPGQGSAAFAWPARSVLPLGAIAFCAFLAEGTVNDWSAVHLAEVTGAPAAVASLGYFAFSLTMIAVRLSVDRVAARAGAAQVVRWSCGLGVIGFGLAVAAAEPVGGVLAYAVIGLGVAAVVPMAWSTAAARDPAAAGRAIAGVATCGYLGFLVGPVLVGGVADALGYRASLLIPAAALLVAAFLAPALRSSAVR